MEIYVVRPDYGNPFFLQVTDNHPDEFVEEFFDLMKEHHLISSWTKEEVHVI